MHTKKIRKKKKQKQKPSTQIAAVEVSLPANFFRGGQASLSLLEFNQNRAHKCQIQGGWVGWHQPPESHAFPGDERILCMWVPTSMISGISEYA